MKKHPYIFFLLFICIASIAYIAYTVVTQWPNDGDPVFMGNLFKQSGLLLRESTVADLPDPTLGKMIQVINDGNNPTDCILGGGGNKVVCFSDGSIWRNLTATATLTLQQVLDAGRVANNVTCDIPLIISGAHQALYICEDATIGFTLAIKDIATGNFLTFSDRLYPNSPKNTILSNGTVCDTRDATTGQLTFANYQNCRPLEHANMFTVSTDGTQCGAVAITEVLVGNGAQHHIRCNNNTGGLLYMKVNPLPNLNKQTLYLSIPVVNTNGTANGTIAFDVRARCVNPNTDNLTTVWTQTPTSGTTTFTTQNQLRTIEITHTVTGTCTSASIVEIRLNIASSSNSAQMGTSGQVYILADEIGVYFEKLTNR